MVVDTLCQRSNNIKKKICLCTEHIRKACQLDLVIIELEPLLRVNQQAGCYRHGKPAYLVAYAAVRRIVPGFKLSHVNNHTEEIVYTRSLQLHVLSAIAATDPICVWEHIEL